MTNEVEKELLEKKKIKKQRKRGEHYVDNELFQELMTDYIILCREAESNDEPRPMVPDLIAKKLLRIATYICFRPNFSGYSWRSEMIGDSVLNCLKYVHKYNPDKYSNPFGYFTKICWYANLRRISTEKKQHHIKSAMVQRGGSIDFMNIEHDTEIGDEYMNYVKCLFELDTEAFFNKGKAKKESVKLLEKLENASTKCLEEFS